MRLLRYLEIIKKYFWYNFSTIHVTPPFLAFVVFYLSFFIKDLLMNYIFFYCLLNILSSSIVLLTSTTPVIAAISLAIAFINASFIFLIMNFEFIALIFLIVYVGAIIILFLFTIMLLHLRNSTPLNMNALASRKIPFLLQCFFYTLFYFIPQLEGCFLDDIAFTNQFVFNSNALNSVSELMQAPIIEDIVFDYAPITIDPSLQTMPSVRSYNIDLEVHSELAALGLILYTNGSVYFILASIVLLIALIGSVVLITADTKNSYELQHTSNQNAKGSTFYI